MALSAQFPPQKSAILESSKIAFLQYVTDRKQPLHNFQQRSVFWDRQHLYNQNLMLRNKIKQMTENNTKTKTQLMKSEKDLIEMTSKKIKTQVLRSSSTNQFGKDKELSVMKFRVDALKQQQHSKRLLALKLQIRKLKEQVQSLQAQNVQLKKSIKYTRIQELQIQNKQLHQQILRIGGIAVNLKENHSQIYKDFLRQKQEMNQKVRKEVEARAQTSRQLKRLKLEIQEMNFKFKNQPSDKKLLTQISFLQRQNCELKGVLEISLKNNSQLQQTLQSYIKNNNLPENQSNMTRLEYSATGLSQFPMSSNKINHAQNKFGLKADLTSLQLLTPNSSLKDFRTSQKGSKLKFQEKIYEAPYFQEEDNRLFEALQKSTNSVNLQQRYITNYDSIPPRSKDSSSQYEYILQDF